MLRANYIICPMLHYWLIAKLSFKCRASGSRVWSLNPKLCHSPWKMCISSWSCSFLDFEEPVSFILRKIKQLFDISIFLLFCHTLQTNHSQYSHSNPIISKHIYYRCLFMTWFQRTENITASSTNWFKSG